VHQRLPVALIRIAAPVVAVALLLVARGLPESSPIFAAVEERSWSLRVGLRLARSLTDGDRDGYSARFGGGDCDDSDPNTYPGGVDTPGDGVDQNCTGGDARPADAPGAAGPAAGAPGSGAPGAPTTPPTATRRDGPAFDGNLLIVTIDSLRADRLGVAGYTRRNGRSLTPALDALANRGAYFKRAWAQAPNTPRSFPSLLTGGYPSDVAWTQRSSNYSPIAAENQTFFEALATTGQKPIGIFSHFYFTADRGLSQGFAEWSNDGAGTISESNKDIAAPRIVPKVIARLETAAKRGERFALWTHLFEPHSSYMTHAGFPTSSLRGVEGLEEKYDFEIAFVDGWVGKLLAALEAAGLGAKTAIVVAADHGEAWGEHRRYFHGTDLTEEQLRVPLIIAVPGKAARVIEEPVALVDLAPTLLDLVGLAPLPSFRGRSLLPALDGATLTPRPIFAELLPAPAWPKHETMMVDGATKLTHKIGERRFELHDLAADPRQQRDVSRDPAHAATLETLKRRLLDFEEGRR
jgi:arylsulfatase A-like enzyme